MERSYVLILVLTVACFSTSAFGAPARLEEEMSQVAMDDVKQQTAQHHSGLQERMSELEGIISDLQKELKQQSRQSGFGFTATTSDSSYYSDGQTVIFEQEIYDGNNNYDSSTGVYTCPASGTYQFSFQIMGQEEVGSTFCIQVGSLRTSCNHATGSEGADMGSGATVIHCPQNEVVYVQVVNQATLFGSIYDVPTATFSGALVAIDAQY